MLYNITYCPNCNSAYNELKLHSSTLFPGNSTRSFQYKFDSSRSNYLDDKRLRSMINYGNDTIQFSCKCSCNLYFSLSSKKVWIESSLPVKIKSIVCYCSFSDNKMMYWENGIIYKPTSFDMELDFYKISSKFIEDKILNLLLL